jgi:hypothetical protein
MNRLAAEYVSPASLARPGGSRIHLYDLAPHLQGRNPTAYNPTVTNQRVILLMAEYRLTPDKSGNRKLEIHFSAERVTQAE